MARGMKALLALAALPRAAALHAYPAIDEPQAEADAALASATTTAAPRVAEAQLIGGARRSEYDLMHPPFEKSSNLRVGSMPNASLDMCPICNMHPADAPKLWLREASDGIGTRVHNMIVAMAVAAKNGMNTAGFVSIPGSCPVRIFHGETFGVNPKLVYDFFFGLNSTDLFVNMRQPHCGRYENMQELEKYTGDLLPVGRPDPLAPGSQSYMHQPDLVAQFSALHTKKAEIQQYFTKDFISKLRAMGSVNVMTRPTWFATDGRPTVAVHVRRGEVKEKSANRHRWTPDSWYMDKIAKVRHMLPDADVHVFTSVDQDTDPKDLYTWNNTVNKLTVHTDSDKNMASHATMDAWAHFAQADIVILSRSSYGHVPAMLNTNCVIYQEYWNAPLEGWIWAEDSEQGSKNLFDQGAFNSCIRRIARPSWGLLGATR